MHHFSMVATFKTKPLGSYEAKKVFYYYELQPSLSLEFRAKIQTRDSSDFHCSALCSEVHIIVALQRFGFKGCYQA